MKINIIFSIILFASIANSQALLLENGKSGTNFSLGLNALERSSSVYLDAGFSPNGRLNVGAAIVKTSVDNIRDYGEFSIMPYVQYFFIKQDRNVPLSVAVGASYQRITDTGGFFKDEGLNLTGNAFSGNILVAHNIDVSRSFRLIPFGSISYGHVKVKISDGFDDLSESDDIIRGSLGIMGAIAVNDHFFSISTGLILNKNETGFSLSLSYNIQ